MKHRKNHIPVSRLCLVWQSGLCLCLGALSVSAAEPRYYVNDHLATTVGITDAAGEIAAIEADAFGSPMSAADNAGRFTGKPYDADLGAYVFPFRNYRADEARWMSADPSGFPDGVNATYYSPVPNIDIDSLGLLKNYTPVVEVKDGISVNIFQVSKYTIDSVIHYVSYQKYTASTNDSSMEVVLWKAINPPTPAYGYNCHGYAYTKSASWWIDNDQVTNAFLAAEGYKEVSSISEAKLVTYKGNEHSGVVVNGDDEMVKSKLGVFNLTIQSNSSLKGLYGAAKYWE